MADGGEEEEQHTGERVLAQTAALFTARGDTGAVALLRAVQRLDFEQTDEGYTTATNWHDYYWAAVFYIEEVDRPAFSSQVLDHLLPTLIEVAAQNQQSAVNRIHVRPLLPDPDQNWRQTAGQLSRQPTAEPADPSGSRLQTRITEVTRRRIFDTLRLQNAAWAGGLEDADFLKRIYDLDALPSYDPRYPTAEGDINQHRWNNQDWDDDWVFTDSRFALTRGPDSTFLAFLAEMLHPVVRPDEAEVARLLELFNEALGRDGYALVAYDSISGFPLFEGRRTAVQATLPTAAHNRGAGETTLPAQRGHTSGAGEDSSGYEAVRRRARGERKDYSLDRVRLVEGGQAEVFRAVHKTSQTEVAFKRRLSFRETPVARMRREIEISRLLNGHPHYMPILDANADDGWLVMPLADGTAAQRRDLLNKPGELRSLVKSLIDVLALAHRHDWLHRDIKPDNILLLENRWTLADWGIVRRPRGKTTKAGRTSFEIGSEGFAAPELSVNAHEASHASDIYSVGRVIAWAVTGTDPQPNIALLPPPGPWRTIVRATTQHDPAHRPQHVHDLLTLIDRELSTPPISLQERAQTLQVKAQSGDQSATDQLLKLAADHPESFDLYVRALTELRPPQATSALLQNASQATELLQALGRHVHGDGRVVQFGEAARVVMWLHAIAAVAATRRAWDLFDEAARTMLIWDGAWDQWSAQDRVTPWLRALSGDAASLVAAALHDHPSSARHFSGLVEDAAVDVRIRQAVQAANSAQRF
ncbi:protein kinase [Streptomyces sp. NPDC058412]|uniref:AbiJ-related protein n=1 Tax=Streptomyces sp. NPDC058412 TaxID=3346486 RepID=UPI00365FD170